MKRQTTPGIVRYLMYSPLPLTPLQAAQGRQGRQARQGADGAGGLLKWRQREMARLKQGPPRNCNAPRKTIQTVQEMLPSADRKGRRWQRLRRT